MASMRPALRLPNTMITSPAVATTSPRSAPEEARWWSDTVTALSSNIRLATTQPTTPPRSCAAIDSAASRVVTSPGALGGGDDRVEAGGDRLQGQDQRYERGSRDQAVLEE